MPRIRPFLLLIALAASVAGLSFVSVSLQAEAETSMETPGIIRLNAGMSIRDFGQLNGLSDSDLRDIFGLDASASLDRQVMTAGLDRVELERQTRRALALAREHASKNWTRILVKFGLWFLYLALAFLLLRTGRVTAAIRRWLLLGATILFGVVLGADPNPMGTVKDAVALLGRNGVIFPPRLVALGVFLLLVLLVNKFICAWGCQFGTLQDLVFRLNRNRTDSHGRMRQAKLPFALTNTVRVITFVVFSGVALLWATDIIAPVDPFKIFHPQTLALGGAGFLAILLFASLFVYRPWCHLFCPFGLIGWVIEKISLVRIDVDYDACIACGACARACPSTVMEAILKQEKRTIPDCFACGTCLPVCPTRAVDFRRSSRRRPPAGKFDSLN